MTRLAALVSVLFTVTLWGFEARLLDAQGRPIRAAQVSIVGRSGSIRTDDAGRFALSPDPALPATLIVIGSRGEVFPPFRLTEFPSDIRLDSAFRETMTVTSGAAPHVEAPPAAATVVIGAEEVEERRPQHLADAVARTTGVSVRGEGPAAVPVVRGLSGGRTLLLIDDARVVAERRAGPSGTFLNPATLSSIEIARGPGSVAYGSDAMGGVIHARPRDPVPGEEEVHYDLTAAGGGEERWSAGVRATWDVLGGAILAGLHSRSGDDGRDADGERILNSSYEDRGAILRFVRYDDTRVIRAGLRRDEARNVGAPSADAAVNQTIYPFENATSVSASLERDLPGQWSRLEIRASLGTYEIDTTRRTAATEMSSIIEAHDATLRLSAALPLTDSRLQLGIDGTSRFGLHGVNRTGAVEEIAISDAQRTDIGLFAIGERAWQRRLLLTGGIRADAIATRNRGGFFGSHDSTSFAPSGHLALTAGPFRDLTATLQVSSGYREPSLSDRYFRGVSGRGFIVGNPDLQPERSLQFDGSLRWQRERTRVILSTYHYTIRDLVERYRSGSDFRFRNRGRARVEGIEIEAESRLASSFVMQGGTTLSRGRALDDGAPLDDIAPWNGHLTLHWAAARASVFGTATFVARDDEPGPVETIRPGYTNIEIGAGWRFSNRLEVRLALQNATNVSRFGSADANAARAAGRSVIIGISGELRRP